VRKVQKVLVETGDTEPRNKSVQLSAVSFSLLIPAQVICKRKGGGVSRVGWRWQIIEESAEGPSGNSGYSV
jgi:hypothetical protein